MEIRDFGLNFECYHFDNSMFESQYHNFIKNQLSLVKCPTISSIDFMNGALKIYNAGFGSAFCDRLARLQSLQTPTVFHLVEQMGQGAL